MSRLPLPPDTHVYGAQGSGIVVLKLNSKQNTYDLNSF
jgi:hypothetical protein